MFLRRMAMTMASRAEGEGPITAAMRSTLQQVFAPVVSIEITNNSHLHAHHAAMRAKSDLDKAETHFQVTIVSDAFKDQNLIKRHRAVYAALDNMLDKGDGGIHALQITARTVAEAEAKK